MRREWLPLANISSGILRVRTGFYDDVDSQALEVIQFTSAL